MWPLVGKQNTLDVPNSIALLGDSITARHGGTSAIGGFGGDGYFVAGNMLLGNRFNIKGIYATSGYTIAQIATNHVPSAIAARPDFFFVLAGTNDAGGATAGDVMFAALRDSIILPLLATGGTVFVGTIPPNSGWTNKYIPSLYNSLIRRLPDTYPRCIVVDFERVLMDYSTGNWRTGFNSDAAHPNFTGAMYMGLEIYNTVQLLFSSTPPGYQVGGNHDATQYAANPKLNGNNASGVNKFVLGAGASGTGPDSHYVLGGATGTGVCTGNVARLDKFSGSAFQVACSFAANGDSVLVQNGPGNLLYFFRTWAASTGRTIGEFDQPTTPNGFLYKAVVAGTTAGSQPTWPTTLGGTVVDGGVTWQCMPLPVTGDRFIAEVSFAITAQSGQILPRFYIQHQNAAFDSTLRPSFEVNGTTVASNDMSVYANQCSTFTNLYDTTALPLNTLLTLRTPVIIMPANTHYFIPVLRFFGTAGSSCTGLIHGWSLNKV